MEGDVKQVEEVVVVVRFAMKWYRTKTDVSHLDVITPGVQLPVDWMRKLWG
jgi:hypothetical protein